MNEVENTPLEKRDKEEQLRAALRSYARLDTMKRSGAEDTTLRLNKIEKEKD